MCPDCHGSIVPENDTFRCTKCGRRFQQRNGIPILLPSQQSGYLPDEISYWDTRFEYEVKTSEDSPEHHYRYDAFAANYAGLYPYKSYLSRLPADARIVEIGSGTNPKGLYLTLFQHFRNVYMTDVSVVGLEVARSYANSRGSQTDDRFLVMDAAHLAIRPNSVDAVFCHSALHHLDSPAQAIRSMVDCLQPGGLLILGHEPNLYTYGALRKVADSLRKTERHLSHTYSVADAEVLGFRPRDMSRWCRAAGASVIDAIPVWYLQGLVFFAPGLLTRLLPSASLAVPRQAIDLAGKIDAAIRKLPLLSQFPFFWTVVAQKRPAHQA